MRVAGKEKSNSSWRQRVPAWMGWIYSIAALFCLVMIPFRYAVGRHIGRFTYLVLTVLGKNQCPIRLESPGYSNKRPVAGVWNWVRHGSGDCTAQLG